MFFKIVLKSFKQIVFYNQESLGTVVTRTQNACDDMHGVPWVHILYRGLQGFPAPSRIVTTRSIQRYTRGIQEVFSDDICGVLLGTLECTEGSTPLAQLWGSFLSLYTWTLHLAPILRPALIKGWHNFRSAENKIQPFCGSEWWGPMSECEASGCSRFGWAR